MLELVSIGIFVVGAIIILLTINKYDPRQKQGHSDEAELVPVPVPVPVKSQRDIYLEYGEKVLSEIQSPPKLF